MNKCSRCEGVIYFDGEEHVCINCGFRPHGYATIDYSAWQYSKTYYTDAEVGETGVWRPNFRPDSGRHPLPLVHPRELR